MKKLLLLIALLLPALFVTAQGIKNGLKEEPKINVGIKGGFNSSMYFTSRLELDGERMEDVQNNYKVGYFAAMFFREVLVSSIGGNGLTLAIRSVMSPYFVSYVLLRLKNDFHTRVTAPTICVAALAISLISLRSHFCFFFISWIFRSAISAD